MSEGLIVLTVLLGIVGASWLLTSLVIAAFHGATDADFPRSGRTDDTLLYGPVRDYVYRLAFTRRKAQLERIKQIKKERGLW